MLTRLIQWYGKRVVYGTTGLVVILLLIGAYFVFHKTTPAEVVGENTKRVSVKEAGALGEESIALHTVGTVRAVSEARLETESSGRVVSVNAAIGDHVTAGSILASIENSRERAALLQAEGAYEAAQASNAQSGIGLSGATVSAQNTYRTAYTTGDDIIRNLIDELFSNPESQNPGIRIGAKGQAPELVEERKALEGVLNSWKQKIVESSASPDEQIDRLNEAEKDLTRIGTFVSSFALFMSNADPDEIFTPEVISTYKTRLSVARSRIDTTLQTISSARESLRSAQQSTQGSHVASESSARIKQALGSLRSAQAAYEKTLVRSPISGEVNAFYLRANEYIGMNAPAAVVANNNALEITTSVSEEERALIAIGNKVTVNDTLGGTITRIAPAVDPQTGKIEIKISVDDEKATTLENGTTVSLELQGAGVETQNPDLRIPLRALKITAEGPTIFTVKDDGALESHSVTLGALIGDVVVVESGIDKTTRIVTDARGLKEGEKVEIVTE